MTDAVRHLDAGPGSSPGQAFTGMTKPHFAGEHANSFYGWQGFMEGAALSGIQTAREILRDSKVGPLVIAGFLHDLNLLSRPSLFVLMHPEVVEIFRCKYIFRLLAKPVFVPQGDASGLPRELDQAASFVIEVGPRQSQNL